MDLWVRVFYHEGKPVAEHVDSRTGKITYAGACRIAKQVAIGSNERYRVRIRSGECVKVLKRLRRKKISRKVLLEIKELLKGL